MCRKFCLTVLLAALASLAADAQELLFNGEISTHFDNTEYAGSDCGTSRTIFAVRVLPSLEYRWNDRHSVVLGASALKDFGSKRFIDRADLVAYYGFENGKFGANAGIFERSHLVGRYSRAFFSDSTLIYNNLIRGIAMGVFYQFRRIQTAHQTERSCSMLGCDHINGLCIRMCQLQINQTRGNLTGRGTGTSRNQTYQVFQQVKGFVRIAKNRNHQRSNTHVVLGEH